ncbi:hypothetical protein [Telmatospirillum siberiense]|uniref:Uncharacterized protein n=1 Tax=Telmatospirillum siberiense TaxID=382514 RepID=A0A2N3PT62_9PROT|nr:hypothetical protein [Telmatospirillum siberiense]PKU23593.1 hypothetical protein CWS72_16155 [Telmatospirillum siberiense]
MFDILATIVGTFEGEADVLAFAQDIEACVVRARRRGIVVEVRDNRLAEIIRKRTLLPQILDDRE